MQTRSRREIFTDEREITSENIIKVLRDAYIVHQINAIEEDYLIRYEAGEQPLNRTKVYRPEVNTQCIDNIANEVTEFKLGYKWGNPITFVQRGELDSGTKEESKAISMLNEQYETVGVRAKTQELARFVEICGVGYVYIDINTDYEDGDAYFVYEVLDPRYAFVVKANGIGKKPLLGVTYRRDSLGNAYFTCFSKNRRYEIVNVVKVVNGDGTEENADIWNEVERSGEINPIGAIPIIEYVRSYDRMGCFERQIPDMDALNILESDMVNASSEQVDCIWHCNDVDFPEDENGNVDHPHSNEWLQTYTTKDGKTPFVTALSPNYDYAGNLNNVVTKRSLILQKCNVPQRNDNSGGSTGIAMSDASGWSAAEASACKDEQITSKCKIDELKVVLKAIAKSTDIEESNPLLDLRYSDVVPSIKRQKSYELTNKANAIVTLLNAGFNGSHVLKAIPFFEDPAQTWADSKKCVEKKQNAEKEQQVEEPNKDRIMQDNSDQNENSPNLDK